MKTIRCAAAAAACLFLFTGCMFHDDTLSPQNARTKTCTAQEAIPSGAVSLNTDISVGDVTVSYGDGQDVSVQASVKANHGKTASGAEELLGLTEVALTQDGKILRVAVRSSKTRTDMWQWIKQNRPDTDYSADLDITVPQSMDSFVLYTKVGDIRLNAPHGVVTAQADVGDVDAENPTFSGESLLKADVGNVTCAFTGAQPGTGNLSIYAGTGDIHLQAADGLVQSSTTHKQVTGGAETTVFHSGLTVSSDTKVGSITGAVVVS
ncbi:hypothetical protein [Ethanoligenens harbinense]|uniref:Adhesin domain-containing protein n=1 Tax=Ethanoligenens harbinense (strain DSM 18485 / JCM 12961 / CGMCC 1.5033 / YUAN-3) TaxID=663278 RepID=E6U841_ETHHY|nr:hypothetical protein [Ethanoligenens harbinense]ADU27060.1 hypothetical protein Ethha_1524 [Ethanoligenens harbinense YUAN-3]AVQ96140.1 hypothetical protein CXQ68_07820 [Ethanoligenens harbinense YUAN-3]AYF38800.1 hypothetical protein CXP51_07690 [Ethanoligenens harbinense]AYF41550.1 hypothetical protein CN246_07835 [Ethanoligenens harbinense]QCN92381.1 hypothetical protein DRA42_07850 [Ethanoligenens harbinense]